MAVHFVTNFIMVVSLLFPLLSCAPLKIQEPQEEDPDLYRTAVGEYFSFAIKYFIYIYSVYDVILQPHSKL